MENITNARINKLNASINNLAHAAEIYFYFKNKLEKDFVNTDEEHIKLDEAEKEYQKTLIQAIYCLSKELSTIQE